MSEQVLGMFQRALTAFIQEDAQAAPYGSGRGSDRRAVFPVYVEVIDLVAHPYNMQRGNYVLCVAHNLERTANGVTNVRERMLFIATGELSEISNTLRHPVRY
jgi:phosphate uptake regulator